MLFINVGSNNIKHDKNGEHQIQGSGYHWGGRQIQAVLTAPNAFYFKRLSKYDNVLIYVGQ